MKMKRYLLLALVAVVQADMPAFAEANEGNEYLDMDIAQLMSITITSVAKKEQPLSDAAAAVFVITQDSIVRLGFCMNNFLVLLTLRVRLTGLHS